jgi:hypothetical protein
MRLFSVQQHLVSSRLVDLRAEVRSRLDGLGLAVPAGDVALTVGSRGIANLPLIIRTIGDWLREHGARPFLVPCMGSHNGATAAGQRQMLESLGITEQAMQMPIRSSMECVQIGQVPAGPVWMDRYCQQAAGVLVVNRIKLHTAFSGPLQSGLVKMMVVGMGKLAAATAFHSVSAPDKAELLRQMGQCLIDSGRILAGLAILEDGFDQTAEIHALPATEIVSREPELLARYRHYFPSLPVDELNVLVVEQIGKNYSGTGMDTNVIGYRGVRGEEDLDRPRIRVIAALRLSPDSQGNAIGVGLADFITRRLRDAIDEQKTLINVLTTGEMQRGKIPITLASDEELVRTIRERFGDARWMFIPNTLHLGQLYVTPDLAAELRQHPRCTVLAESHELRFEKAHLQLPFDASY